MTSVHRAGSSGQRYWCWELKAGQARAWEGHQRLLVWGVGRGAGSPASISAPGVAAHAADTRGFCWQVPHTPATFTCWMINDVQFTLTIR